MNSEEAATLTFDFPTHIEFGVGRIKILSTSVASSQRSLMVTGRSANQRLGNLEFCRQPLLDSGAEVAVHPGFEANARCKQIIPAADFYAKSSCDSIIALGGGSIMDAARGIALAVSHKPTSGTCV
jgi:alcohol dehydrogenase class IV